MSEATLNMQGPAPTTAAQADDKLSFWFVAVFLSLCIPMFFTLGGLYLSLSRVLLLMLFPYLFFKVYAGKYGGVRWTDLGMLLFVIWLGLSIFVNNRSTFVTFVGSNAIIILGGYMVGRAYIRGPNSFISFIKLFGLTLLATLPFALYETQTSHMVIPRLLDKLPLISSSIDVNYPPRNGMYRVQVLFTHPIHYGLFASMCFSLIYVGFRTVLSTPVRLAWTACVAVCCFSAVSSGPLLSMLVQIALLFYAWAAVRMKNKWSVLIGTFSVFYIILDLLSNRPAYFAIVERMAFNPATAFVRKILLEYGFAQIARTPVLGVGYNEWALPTYMTGSVDNYWLLTALIYGVPAFLAVFSAFLYTLIKAGRRDFTSDPLVTNLRSAWSFVIVSLILTLSTVAIWSDIATLVFLFLGAGVWMIDYAITQDSDEPSETEAPTRGQVYTRFANRSTAHGSRSALHQSRSLSQGNSRI